MTATAKAPEQQDVAGALPAWLSAEARDATLAIARSTLAAPEDAERPARLGWRLAVLHGALERARGPERQRHDLATVLQPGVELIRSLSPLGDLVAELAFGLGVRLELTAVEEAHAATKAALDLARQMQGEYEKHIKTEAARLHAIYGSHIVKLELALGEATAGLVRVDAERRALAARGEFQAAAPVTVDTAPIAEAIRAAGADAAKGLATSGALVTEALLSVKRGLASVGISSVPPIEKETRTKVTRTPAGDVSEMVSTTVERLIEE